MKLSFGPLVLSVMVAHSARFLPSPSPTSYRPCRYCPSSPCLRVRRWHPSIRREPTLTCVWLVHHIGTRVGTLAGSRWSYPALGFTGSGVVALLSHSLAMHNSNNNTVPLTSDMVYVITNRRVLSLEASSTMLPWPLASLFARRLVLEYRFEALIHEWAAAKQGEPPAFST